MKSHIVKSLGLSLTVLVASTVAEYDQLAKKDGACLESANQNTVYRGMLAEFRAEFLDRLEKLGIAEFPEATQLLRLTKPSNKKVKEGEEPPLVFAETEGEYFKRFLVVLGELRSARDGTPVVLEPESFQSVADALLQEVDDKGELVIKFDPSATEAGPKNPQRLPAVYLNAGFNVFDAGKAELFAAKYGLAHPKLPDGSTAEAIRAAWGSVLGKQIQALELAEAAQKNLADKYTV